MRNIRQWVDSFFEEQRTSLQKSNFICKLYRFEDKGRQKTALTLEKDNPGSYTKKDLIPLMLIEAMDRENKIRMTLDEMAEIFDYPKTSLSTLFTKLKKRDFIQRVRNGEYMINPAISYKGSKPERDQLMEEYNSLSKKKVK